MRVAGGFERPGSRGLKSPNPLGIELFNLDADIGESKDVASEHPEIVARMRKIMQSQHVPSAQFPMPPIDK